MGDLIGMLQLRYGHRSLMRLKPQREAHYWHEGPAYLFPWLTPGKLP